jgi:hypothetical protein
MVQIHRTVFAYDRGQCSILFNRVLFNEPAVFIGSGSRCANPERANPEGG